jgi:hypothetical protein
MLFQSLPEYFCRLIIRYFPALGLTSAQPFIFAFYLSSVLFHCRITETSCEKDSVNMQISFGILAAVLGSSWFAAAAPTEPSASDLLLELNEKAKFQLENSEVQFNKGFSRKKCTIANAAVRRDW